MEKTKRLRGLFDTKTNNNKKILCCTCFANGNFQKTFTYASLFGLGIEIESYSFVG